MNSGEVPSSAIDAIGQPSERRATRAVLLSYASRIVLVTLAGTGVFLATGGLVTSPHESPLASLAPMGTDGIDGPDAASGIDIADMLRSLEAVAAEPGFSLVSFELGRPEGRRAPVAMTFDIPGQADGMVSVLGAVERAGIDGPFPRAVTPIPVGLRADIAGHVLLSVRRLPTTSTEDVPLAVVLTEEIARAGVVLRRLVVDPEGERMVHLEVDGSADATLALLERIERHHAAPVRFASIAGRRTESGGRLLTLVFRPRGDA